MRVGVARGHGRLGEGIPDPGADRAAGDAVGLGETAVEPDRRVEGADLVDEHVGELGLEDLRLLGVGEVAVQRFARLAERARDARHNLARAPLASGGGNPGLPEVLGHDDVGSELRPVGRNRGPAHLEDGRAVRVLDAGVALLERDAGEGIGSRGGEAAAEHPPRPLGGRSIRGSRKTSGTGLVARCRGGDGVRRGRRRGNTDVGGVHGIHAHGDTLRWPHGGGGPSARDGESLPNCK